MNLSLCLRARNELLLELEVGPELEPEPELKLGPELMVSSQNKARQRFNRSNKVPKVF